jgi:hypothetical protein
MMICLVHVSPQSTNLLIVETGVVMGWELEKRGVDGGRNLRKKGWLPLPLKIVFTDAKYEPIGKIIMANVKPRSLYITALIVLRR